MFLKRFFFCFLLLSFYLTGHCQVDKNSDKDKKNEKDTWQDIQQRIFYGGNLGAQFGGYTFVDISPFVGYRVTEQLSLGAGVSYNMLQYRYGNNRYRTDIYGGRLFGRYFVWENLFIHGEYEVLNGQWDYTQKRFNIINILGGGGYRQMISDRAGMTLLVLWNFNQTQYSPYSNPIIRGGFTFGF